MALNRYTNGEYLSTNPDWHIVDSRWKAAQVLEMLHDAKVHTVCEVGCGAGEILRQIHDHLPDVRRLVGYEIAETPLAMALERESVRLTFKLRDAAQDDERFDLMLIMDVIEHVSDPIAFLTALRFKAARTILHVPLDLSAQAMLRPGKLIAERERVGHIHYFTPETALATVRDAGYMIQGYAFTPSYQTGSGSLKGRLARIPRRLLPKSLTIRVLGGYSMLIDASNV